jgi:membrane protein DedA with SNARE-associated domain
MLFEGELFLMATGMLVRLQAFDPFDAFFFALAGVLTGDILWYSLGSYLQKKHSQNRYLMFAIRRVKMLLPGIEKNPFHVIFLSKFIYGLNHSTILVLGFLKIEFRHFMKIQFFTSLAWVLIFLILGYVFGGAALAYAHSFNRFVLIALGLLISVIIIERIIGFFIEVKEQENK